ncbi:MAG: hypothetical protein GY730_09390 [bacterium]|nr:hypothetical protein [bacterium]
MKSENKPISIAYVDDDAYCTRILPRLLQVEGMCPPEYNKYKVDIKTFSSLSDFEKSVNIKLPDLTLIDIVHPPSKKDQLKTDAFGFIDNKWFSFSLIKKIRSLHSDAIIFVYSNHYDQETKDRFFGAGVDHFIQKDCVELKQEIIDNYQIVKKIRQSKKENLIPLRPHYFGDTLAKLELKVRDIILNKTDKNCLITGEIGTGKKIVLDFFEDNLHKNKHSYIRIDCSDLEVSKKLKKMHPDDFILCEEISLLPLFVQDILLQNSSIKIIATSNIDLNILVQQGEFNNDLYQKIKNNVFHIPPLRDRRQEIAQIANGLARYSFKEGPVTITKDAMEVFEGNDWHNANVKELHDSLFSMLKYLKEDRLLKTYMLPIDLVQLGEQQKSIYGRNKNKVSVTFEINTMDYKDVEDLILVSSIKASIKKFQAINITQVARVLRIPRATLVVRMDRMPAHHRLKINEMFKVCKRNKKIACG